MTTQGSRRHFLQTTAAAGALATIGQPVFAQQAEHSFKWANNIPATHPSTVRIKEAADAIRAGMVRDFRFFVVPRIVGGGLKALPEGADLALSLIEHRIHDDRSTYLHYRAAPAPSAEQAAPLAEQPR